ncbi:oxidoreductase [Rhodococcus sp. SRB_17]|nr:oxidoreductase [Rhodococcus sp. SRB_17]
MGAHVVIIGAGYAGVMAAKRLLRRSSEIAVTIVNPRDHFVQRIRLHQLVTGGYDATVPLNRALPSKANLVVGSVTSIDASAQQLVLDDGRMLRYDFVVYALGSRQSTDSITGAAMHGFTISEFEDAIRLKSKLATLPDHASITIVGGGLTGIETATELAEQSSARITLIAGGVLAPELSEKAREIIVRTLTTLGIDVITGLRVVRIDKHACELSDGRTIATDCAVLTTEFGVPDLARRSGLPVDDLGRLRVDRQLECITLPNIVGAGDAVTINDLSFRMSCQAAIPLGVHAAETIARRIEGSAPKPVTPKFVGQCVSLGRKGAVFQRTTRTDLATRLVVAGRAGAFIKERICSSTTDWGIVPRRPFFYSWT